MFGGTCTCESDAGFCKVVVVDVGDDDVTDDDVGDDDT
jgi:hypothetical protein